jgi:DNA adenine methylase
MVIVRDGYPQKGGTMKSFLAYYGGKSLLVSKILPLIPAHTCYCEVFAGAAWLLFRKEESEVEIINDINTDLVTLYRVIKHHLDEFIRYLRWLLVARDEFERFKLERPGTLTDIQRAVRFYYLLRGGYGARLRAPSFGISTTKRPSFNLLRIEEELSAVHLRLSRVYIENLPYEQILARFDKEHTFFYIDPPYHGCEDCYGKDIFSRDDFSRLASILSRLTGKFIMSINDVPQIRSLFSVFHITQVATSYTVCGAQRRKAVKELLITNYVPKE